MSVHYALWEDDMSVDVVVAGSINCVATRSLHVLLSCVAVVLVRASPGRLAANYERGQQTADRKHYLVRLRGDRQHGCVLCFCPDDLVGKLMWLLSFLGVLIARILVYWCLFWGLPSMETPRYLQTYIYADMSI